MFFGVGGGPRSRFELLTHDPRPDPACLATSPRSSSLRRADRERLAAGVVVVRLLPFSLQQLPTTSSSPSFQQSAIHSHPPPVLLAVLIGARLGRASFDRLVPMPVARTLLGVRRSPLRSHRSALRRDAIRRWDSTSSEGLARADGGAGPQRRGGAEWRRLLAVSADCVPRSDEPVPVARPRRSPTVTGTIFVQLAVLGQRLMCPLLGRQSPARAPRTACAVSRRRPAERGFDAPTYSPARSTATPR